MQCWKERIYAVSILETSMAEGKIPSHYTGKVSKAEEWPRVKVSGLLTLRLEKAFPSPLSSRMGISDWKTGMGSQVSVRYVAPVSSRPVQPLFVLTKIVS